MGPPPEEVRAMGYNFYEVMSILAEWYERHDRGRPNVSGEWFKEAPSVRASNELRRGRGREMTVAR
eukprot:5650709-Alexandrium_andersonii.AAC.1